jgi:hypothetical protein
MPEATTTTAKTTMPIPATAPPAAAPRPREADHETIGPFLAARAGDPVLAPALAAHAAAEAA